MTKTSKKTKRKKQKKRRRSDDADVLNETEGQGHGAADTSTRHDSSKRRLTASVSVLEDSTASLPDKQRSVPTSSPRAIDANNNDDDGGETNGDEVRRSERKQLKKKRKKEKKKKRKANAEQATGTDITATSSSGSNNSVGNKDASPNMEGRMIDGEMVLVDEVSGNVYSALARTDHGTHKQIGKLIDGNIVLDAASVDGDRRDGEAMTAVQQAQPTDHDATAATPFPFEVDPDDHCESPFQAYKDVQRLLQAATATSSRKRDGPTVYDPYFCNGTVVQHLNELGFRNVYNQKEDCYQVWKSKSRYPQFDIFVTNPPYSGDHIEKLMQHITSSSFGQRPWFLLMPQWVHRKDYYISCTSHIRPFYIVPRKRYVYLPPPAFRKAKKSDVHKKSSPFVSMWYVWGGTAQQNDKLIQMAYRGIPNCDVARSRSALRDLRRKKR